MTSTHPARTSQETEKVVVLARGLGTRMRQSNQAGNLASREQAVVKTGVKALIPLDRPFLDYVLSNVAAAGYRKVCLVIGPEHDALRNYYARQVITDRLHIEFAIQHEPKGTADAVASAQSFVGSDTFLAINSDNYYPVDAMDKLRQLNGPGLTVFHREHLVDGSNIPAERITAFAAVDIGPDEYLNRIVEKPQGSKIFESNPWVSMNLWSFTPDIFTACANITPSPRDELEITDAVQYAIDHLGIQFRVLKSRSPVLDLSYPNDIPAVKARLAGSKVQL